MQTPTFYQHHVTEKLTGPSDYGTAELHAKTDDLWGVYCWGQYQSIRGKWHNSSRTEAFARTHTFPYEEALRRAREVVGDDTAIPVPTHISVSVSPNRTGANLLAAHLISPEWGNGRFYAATALRVPLVADGSPWNAQGPWQMYPPHRGDYLISREDAFERAVAYLKKANINGMTIYNTGIAVLERTR